jgi:hypothetical protein
MTTRTITGLAALVAACANSVGHEPADGGVAPDTSMPDVTASVEAGHDAFSADVAIAPTDGSTCDPPDALLVVDRSTRTTCGTSGAHCATNAMCCSGQCDVGSRKCIGDGLTLWPATMQAIDYVTKSPTDGTLRFGLELFPDTVSNAACGNGDYDVPVAAGNGALIASTLASASFEPYTPIGGALQTAANVLAGAKVAGRSQLVILVAFRADTCATSAELPIVTALEGKGVHTFVVGMGIEVDPAALNDLACAGGTAANFSTSCTCSSSGCVAAVPSTTRVYYEAGDELSLQNALATIANGTCCGCNVPLQ